MKNTINVLLVILLLILTAGTAFGEQGTTIQVDIPMHSDEYRGAVINVGVHWNGTQEDIQFMYIESGVYKYFMGHKEYSDEGLDYFILNRTNIENNISEYLNKDLNSHGIRISEVSIRDVQLYVKQNPAAPEIKYNNQHKPIVIYIGGSTSDINWYIVIAAFAAGCSFLALIIVLCNKRKQV